MSINENRNTVYSILKDILYRKFGINLEDYSFEDLNKELLGKTFKLNARDLLYLYHEIEKSFNITIPEKDIVDGKFHTINGIIEIIQNQLEAASCSVLSGQDAV
jgi:peptide maturation system acyl carrier-related protein